MQGARLSVALNDSARELSALAPTAPVDYTTPKFEQTIAKPYGV